MGSAAASIPESRSTPPAEGAWATETESSEVITRAPSICGKRWAPGPPRARGDLGVDRLLARPLTAQSAVPIFPVAHDRRHLARPSAVGHLVRTSHFPPHA